MVDNYQRKYFIFKTSYSFNTSFDPLNRNRIRNLIRIDYKIQKLPSFALP